MSNGTKALLALMLTIIFWSSAFVGIRFIMENFSSGGLALSRYFVASIAMAIPFVFIRNKKMPSVKEALQFLIMGCLGFFIYNVLLNEGEITVSAGIANFIVSQLPLFVIIFASIFYRERINRYGAFGIIISILGTLLILLSEHQGGSFVGVVFIYVATLSAAIYSTMQKKLLVKFHPIEVISYCIWAGTLMLLIFLPVTWKNLSHATSLDYMVIIYMGVFPGAIAYALWAYAFKHIKASIASSTLYVMPISSLFLAWLFLGEHAEMLTVMGGIIAVLGAVILSKFGVKK
ncbi:DMT family transporter [Fangia hongkongensis]|uniref:DMT family transporter n=2 Tax=Fangia hongkongensis TaxID=270495 RepID=UPI000369D6A0|nr:DMT family transporter [Fangia hongkongensis]